MDFTHNFKKDDIFIIFDPPPKDDKCHLFFLMKASLIWLPDLFGDLLILFQLSIHEKKVKSLVLKYINKLMNYDKQMFRKNRQIFF